MDDVRKGANAFPIATLDDWKISEAVGRGRASYAKPYRNAGWPM
jgi:hypothetical protein